MTIKGEEFTTEITEFTERSGERTRPRVLAIAPPRSRTFFSKNELGKIPATAWQLASEVGVCSPIQHH
ncbi:MAG: hypothetical protein DME98_08780 [Verrucomicrobia bacterium]|nr:MAG: hypothetical protein DME98_08780 [Verrucomicrobiota bacterium]PYJ32606.1 MAG: hypothetical protein DME88_10530 [Verrucomicrobiota bacterium]